MDLTHHNIQACLVIQYKRHIPVSRLSWVCSHLLLLPNNICRFYHHNLNSHEITSTLINSAESRRHTPVNDFGPCPALHLPSCCSVFPFIDPLS